MVGSCNHTQVKPTKGGNIETIGQLGSATVIQSEDAKEEAKLDYSEDGVEIPFNDGDSLTVTIEEKPDGKPMKEITFLPKNQGTAKVFSVATTADTGFSYKNTLGEFKVVMKEFRLIMWVGVGFIAVGGLFALGFKDFKSGGISGGIGALILGGYAILPQVYSNWLLVLCIGAAIIPILWFLTYRKKDRLVKASIRAHEKLKEKNPELAAEHSLYFKQDLNIKDIEHAKQIKIKDKKL
jgi:hypothetical protein